MPTKPKKHAAITAALATPDDDVQQPSRRKPGSFNAQVADLAVNETASQAKMIDADLSIAEVQAGLPVMRQELRNNITKVVARAKEATGGEYTVEVTDFTTHARNWFLIALVTRTA